MAEAYEVFGVEIQKRLNLAVVDDDVAAIETLVIQQNVMDFTIPESGQTKFTVPCRGFQ